MIRCVNAQRESVSNSDSGLSPPLSKEFFDREFTVITPFCLNDSARQLLAEFTKKVSLFRACSLLWRKPNNYG